MDSDESRPGSSASNSSSTSGESNGGDGNGSSSHKSRSRSVNSQSSSAASSRDNSPQSLQSKGRGPRSPASPNDSKSLRSISPDEDINGGQRSRSASRDSNDSVSSAESSNGIDNSQHGKSDRRNSTSSTNRSVSRNQSISPARKSNSNKSSRNSSVSSVNSDEDDKLVDRRSDDNSDQEEHHNSRRQQIASAEALKRIPRGQPQSPQSLPPVDDGPGAEADKRIQDFSHEDLSDVSDLESAHASPANGKDHHEDGEEDDEDSRPPPPNHSIVVDLRQKLDERKNQLKLGEEKANKENEKQRANKNSPTIVDELKDIMEKKHDEDALDFEAEDGECPEEKDEKEKSVTKEAPPAQKKDSDGELEDGEELEEGEVSDEDEKRPEETEPKPVCRFYTRGQCTWGMSCRFLHPGVTDKGNYTMFDMIRPVPISHSGPYAPGTGPGFHDFRSERPPMAHHSYGGGGGGGPGGRPPPAEPVVESAWERGLRTAKEMMRKANKRKEQDMDFEDKKMNLSASQDELEKDNYYIRERTPPDLSPPQQHINIPGRQQQGHHVGAYSPPPKYPPRIGGGAPFEEEPYAAARSLRYRELPPHRMPHFEDEIIGDKARRIRPAREVIVQRVEPMGRGDEWNDPWMRSKSPGREKRSKRDRRSYSSNSSYSSSSSSQSGSSSNSSRSPSPSRRRRYNSGTKNPGHKSPIRGRHNKRTTPSTEVPTRRYSKRSTPTPEPPPRRHSPGGRRSPPVAKKRQISPTPPTAKRGGIRSPVNKRKRPSPPPAAPRKPISFSINGGEKLQRRKRSSSSGSESSDSSASESGSSYSSSSSSSSRGDRNSPSKSSRPRDKTASERKSAPKKGDGTKKRTASDNSDAKATAPSSNNSNSASSAANSSKKTTRREELLKQLRAVEDAIARKRKLN